MKILSYDEKKDTVCDHPVFGCGQIFKIAQIKHTTLFNDIGKVHFTCPHCGCDYVLYYDNAKVRNWQKQLREMKHPTPKRAEELRQKIKQEMDRLRGLYGGIF